MRIQEPGRLQPEGMARLRSTSFPGHPDSPHSGDGAASGMGVPPPASADPPARPAFTPAPALSAAIPIAWAPALPWSDCGRRQALPSECEQPGVAPCPEAVGEEAGTYFLSPGSSPWELWSGDTTVLATHEPAAVCFEAWLHGAHGTA